MNPDQHQRAAELFEAAWEVEVGQRAAFLVEVARTQSTRRAGVQDEQRFHVGTPPTVPPSATTRAPTIRRNG